jgi:hypothetical protein
MPRAGLAQSCPAGFDGHTLKPVGPVELYRALTWDVALAPQDSVRRHPAHAKRILVAEDNPVNQRITRAVLERDGHVVNIVADGRQAIAAAETSQYDLILIGCANARNGWARSRAHSTQSRQHPPDHRLDGMRHARRCGAVPLGRNERPPFETDPARGSASHPGACFGSYRSGGITGSFVAVEERI